MKKNRNHWQSNNLHSIQQLCKFDPTFISKPAVEWEDFPNYQEFRKLVNGFKPINDAAERAVKLVSDFNGRITRNPEQHEGLLLVVDENRHTEPKPTKK